MKGVAKDYDRDAAAGCKLSGQSSHRAGTKRRRVIKSGADELLELEGAEEDEADEGDSDDKTHHRRHDSRKRIRVAAQAAVHPQSIARQWASTTQAQSCFPGPPLSCSHARLLLPQFTQKKWRMHATRLWVMTMTIPQKA